MLQLSCFPRWTFIVQTCPSFRFRWSSNITCHLLHYLSILLLPSFSLFRPQLCSKVCIQCDWYLFCVHEFCYMTVFQGTISIKTYRLAGVLRLERYASWISSRSTSKIRWESGKDNIKSTTVEWICNYNTAEWELMHLTRNDMLCNQMTKSLRSKINICSSFT